jgi:hypothetical protein
MWQGSFYTSLGRIITATSSSSFCRAKRQPLPPRVLVMVRPAQRWMDINLQAFKPHWRPSSDIVARSRLSAPSGNVSGGGEFGSIELLGGGHGARPDCFSIVLLKVLCANCMGLCLVSAFSRALLCKMYCHHYYEWIALGPSRLIPC